MTGFFDPVTLIFAAITVVVFWQLWSVLGKRTGHERPPRDQRPDRNNKKPSLIEAPPITIDAVPEKPEEKPPIWTGHAKPDSELAKGLEAIAEKDPSFSPNTFLSGAKIAYEMVLEAFARGDSAKLEALLNAETFEAFSSAMKNRRIEGQRMEFQFVGFDKASLKSATLESNIAKITVAFSSQIISAVYDRDGALVEGHAQEVSTPDDTWIFERDLTQRNPNWLIIATDAA